jgi:hypothetical protein
MTLVGSLVTPAHSLVTPAYPLVECAVNGRRTELGQGLRQPVTVARAGVRRTDELLDALGGAPGARIVYGSGSGRPSR